MNETINLAIIFDASYLKNTKNNQKEIETQLSKFLLFLQTCHKNHSNEKRKIFLSFKISSQFKNHFYRQQYFVEFDKKSWRDIQDKLSKIFFSASNEKFTEGKSLEDHFLLQMQDFASDFYWENNDLLSPSNTHTSCQNISSMNTFRRNIALYITPYYYPLIIESRNTLKAIIKKFQNNSISFVWFSRFSEKREEIHMVNNTVSLFNGCLIPFESINSSISSIARYHAYINTAHILSKHNVHERRNKFYSSYLTATKSSIQVKFTNLANKSCLVDASLINSKINENLSLKMIQEEENDKTQYANAYFFIDQLQISDFLIDSGVCLNIGFVCEQDNTFWWFQALPFCKNFIFYSFCRKEVTNSAVNSCNWHIFEPWYTYHSSYDSLAQLFRQTHMYFPTTPELNKYFKNLTDLRNSICYSDSINQNQLKRAMNFPDNAARAQDNSEYQIHSDYGKWTQLYNQISNVVSVQKDQFQYFVENFLLKIDPLVVGDELDVDQIKNQILLRVFLVNKFADLSQKLEFTNDIVVLLRKLSLLRMPTWVGLFLKNNLIQSNDDTIKSQLKNIYDELCYPRPVSLQSPSPIKTANVFFNNTFIDKKLQSNTNQLAKSRSGAFNNIAQRNMPKVFVKRKQMVVSSQSSNRINSLKEVKRCLFGNKSFDTLSSLSVSSASSNIVFRISPKHSPPEKNTFSCNSCQFYMPNSTTHAFPDENSNPSKAVSDGCFKVPISPSIESCFDKSPAFSHILSPCDSFYKSVKNSPDKKFKFDASLWDTTPFKLYKTWPANGPSKGPMNQLTAAAAAVAFTPPNKKKKSCNIADSPPVLVVDKPL